MEEFDDMDGYLPAYVTPDKTGDELYDLMNELSSYRSWLKEIERLKSDGVAILEYILTKQLTKEIDKSILDSIMKITP